jgi:transposase
LWTYLCESSKLVLYDFTEGRGRAGPSTFLAEFAGGTLQSDGYAGYNEIVERAELTRAGCWAHARRKYYDARRDDRPRCSRMLELIQHLFAIERTAKKLREDPKASLGDAEHLALRHEESTPLIERIEAYTKAWSDEVLPRSAVGEAVSYMRNQWKPLTRFLVDPQLQLDNNAAERAMRHVVLGRKNWTFAGSAEGGHRAAKIYSIVVTCRQHGLDPFVYLRDVFDRLPRGHDPTTLTPAAWKADQLDRPPANT